MQRLTKCNYHVLNGRICKSFRRFNLTDRYQSLNLILSSRVSRVKELVRNYVRSMLRRFMTKPNLVTPIFDDQNIRAIFSHKSKFERNNTENTVNEFDNSKRSTYFFLMKTVSFQESSSFRMGNSHKCEKLNIHANLIFTWIPRTLVNSHLRKSPFV